MNPFITRSNPGPRWSKKGGGVKLGSPASMAGLPGKRAWFFLSFPRKVNSANRGSGRGEEPQREKFSA